MRSLSDNGVQFCAAWETFAPVAYKATKVERYFTIGFGHYGADVKEGQKITRGQALLLLNRDMESARQVVDAVAHPSLNQAQFDAMVDLVFSVGAGALYTIHKVRGKIYTGTGAALRAGDIATLRIKLPQFKNQAGKPLLGLYRRAMGRLALFDGKPWAEAEAIGRAIKSLP